MKAIIISIKPKYVADILNGEKTIEIRKKLPKCDLPIDVYIYCTKDKKYANLINRGGFLTGMVVAKFTLNKVEEIIRAKFNICYTTKELSEMALLKYSCLSLENIHNYLKNNVGYAWHIDNLVIFDKPKEISDFYKVGYGKCAKPQGSLREQVIENYNNALKYQLTRAPQSWCYIED